MLIYISKGYISSEEESFLIGEDTFRILDRLTTEERFYIEDYAREQIKKVLI
jgi:hypothetical protein